MPELRLAFSTLGCHDATAPQIAALVGEVARLGGAGITGVEVRCDRTEGPFALEAPGAERRRAAAVLREAGVERFWIASYLRVADPDRTDAEIRAHMDALLEVAQDVGASAVRVFAGAPVPGEEADALAARRLRDLADRAQRPGRPACRILLETHDSHPRGQDVARVLERAEHPALAAVWDVLHTWRGGETPAETAAALAPWLDLVQVKDAASSDDLRPLPLGAGAVPLIGVLGALARLGYPGWLSLEWERRWFPAVAPLAEVLPSAAAWLVARVEEIA
ncbi:sugar phosphate isomerase/epimerase [Actinospica sp. MGRD01-02]|uniref:Sugar phosphate isomerase/epimerase n=1 Tax=Actinospica acidithermotolerans TaxID=2828514 RepID=A0A941EI88_9ACTN|nr:sugar phosphate isomerase/epimerase family protein [Actinospica acidithermotolerans]MBR7831007.1 sugar phosphate isomerase/epimerase [Actinospica acidithermotolerans]